MIKTIILHHLPDMNDLPAAERWFHRYHIPEVLRNRPVSYVSFRAIPPPAGAEHFGYFNYKVHEHVSAGEMHRPSGLTAMTREVVPLKVIMVNVPVDPTEDFKGREISFEEKNIFRWVTVFRYPQGITAEEGDDWYLNVHASEAARQPRLTRFFSYRVLPPAEGLQGGVPAFLHPKSSMSSDWHRVSEQWYEDSNGWIESVIKSPPQYTRPPWASYDHYPFLEPDVDFASTFILERPTDDWVRQVAPFYV